MKTFARDIIVLPDLSTQMIEGHRFYQVPVSLELHEEKMVAFPSVTTVLSAHSAAGIAQWRSRIGASEADKISKQASGRGTRFHGFMEQWLKNENLEYLSMLPLDQIMTSAVRPTLNRIDNIRLQEQALYSEHLRMAGRLDLLADFDDVRSIIDFKTASKEKLREHIENYFMQAAAYAIMVEERTTIPVQNLVIIIVVEDGSVQVFEGKRDDYVKRLLFYRDKWEQRQL